MVATLDTGQRSHPGGWAGEHLAKEGELSIPPLCSLLPELLCWSLCRHGLAAGNMCPVVRRDRSHRIQGVETVAGKADNSSNRLKFKVTSYNEFRSGCHGVEILLMTAVRV